MKVTLVNKSDSTGGAAVACYRLLVALSENNVDVQLLVQEKKKDNEFCISTTQSKFKKYLNFARFAAERLFFYFYEKSKEVRFAYSPANTGENISNHSSIKQTDVIHLHWINQGFLSIRDLKAITASKKPIIWTLHDMWSFTGGCHYAGDCEGYKSECGHCPFLKNPSKKDLSFRVRRKKIKLFENSNITFVTCSKWLAKKAQESSLLKSANIISIPNPIDTNLFSAKDKTIVRKSLELSENKFLILFGSANIFDKRKGLEFFIQALYILRSELPNTANEIELVIFGKSNQQIHSLLPYKAKNLSYLDSIEKIAGVYSCVDLFVLPSLEDNLPNTVMESLACGTPVVAFNIGGIPEMVDHRENGYLAEYKSAKDLAEGIRWIMYEADKKLLSEKARSKVMANYTHEIVAEKYKNLYNKVLNKEPL